MGNDATGVLLTWLRALLPPAVWWLHAERPVGMITLAFHHFAD